MSALAALMVLVACHAEDTTCLEQPFLVASYVDADSCRAVLPSKIREARKVVDVVYGDCVPVDPELLAGRSIYRSIDPQALAQLEEPIRGDADLKAHAYRPNDGEK
ncbi:hypothetical protein FE840_001775 [Peteryoungia desertarenae]|uniref:Uncharacterized protein n=1 Tax=Peteryoungia desertarenae TaxID=1813451 RepID=A0ABX6QJU7_9HYPH|nr:hypothetical protein [Peteryoungia desertarenae]QLF68380.1 hypothetical protein FE840_001775 [Peteryoungia desertarenae]